MLLLLPSSLPTACHPTQLQKLPAFGNYGLPEKSHGAQTVEAWALSRGCFDGTKRLRTKMLNIDKHLTDMDLGYFGYVGYLGPGSKGTEVYGMIFKN